MNRRHSPAKFRCIFYPLNRFSGCLNERVHQLGTERVHTSKILPLFSFPSSTATIVMAFCHSREETKIPYRSCSLYAVCTSIYKARAAQDSLQGGHLSALHVFSFAIPYELKPVVNVTKRFMARTPRDKISTIADNHGSTIVHFSST